MNGTRQQRFRGAPCLALGLCMIVGISACGGGSDAPPPAPAAPAPVPVPNTITVADGGIVTSTDGKVQLIVPANSASVGGVGQITPVAPSAEVAADPDYVPDSSYRYDGPSMNFSMRANWEIQSPAAVVAQSSNASPGTSRARAMAVPLSSIDPNRMCDPIYAAQFGQQPKMTTVVVPDEADSCPLNCLKTWSGPWGSPSDGGQLLHCSPNEDSAFVTPPTSCPAGWADVSNVEPWKSILSVTNTTFGTNYQLCRAITIPAAPWISSAAPTVLPKKLTCARINNKFVCKKSLIRGPDTYAAYEDKALVTATLRLYADNSPWPPFLEADGTFDPDPKWKILIPASGSQVVPLTLTVHAPAETVGLSQVELYEIKVIPPTTNAPAKFVRELLWRAVPVTETLPQGTKLVVKEGLSFTYASNDAAIRRFVVRAYDWAGNAKDSPVLPFRKEIAGAPTIGSFTATPAAVAPPSGSVTLSWNVTGAQTVVIDQGIGAVSATGSTTVNVNASTVFTLTATSPLGVVSTQTTSVTLGPDVTPPAVSLVASSSSVVAPASVTLTATASDAVGVSKVEFYRGTTLLSTDSAAPYEHVLALTAADAGTSQYTAKAFDAANNSANSAAVSVTVTVPSSGDTYASPTGNDVSNTTCAQPTPCRTIAKAAQVAGSGKTAWLLDGTYDSATQGFGGITLPAGVTVRAANAGVPVVKRPFEPQGNATIADLRFGSGGGVSASAGSISLQAVSFIDSLNSPLNLSGTAALTLTPGSVANYIASATAPTLNYGVGRLATVADNASLTINGGSFDANGDGLGISGGASGILASGNAQITVSGVSLMRTAKIGIQLTGGAQLALTNTMVQGKMAVSNDLAAGVWISGSNAVASVVSINGSTIRGYQYNNSSAAIRVAADGLATVSGANNTFNGSSSLGIYVDAGAAGTFTLADTTIESNIFGGVLCQGPCNFTMSGGAVSGNGTSTLSFSYYGGLSFIGSGVHNVSLRNVAITNNKSATANGNNNVDTNSGITAGGGAGSVFDLGTGASPGGNTITGNTTGNQTTGINVKAAAGVTVNAVGNTFMANTQGANAAGQYALGTAPCQPASCLVTAGTGANYRVTTGALRLAQ